MAIRPIDIARKLKISTTTLRTYEEIGVIPPVSRSSSGYRVFTEEHVAYFVCIREMLGGFSLTFISKVLKNVMASKIDIALWMINKSQAELRQEKIISEKLMRTFLNNNKTTVSPNQNLLTINDVSKETGVSATTIRYWDKVGLISAERGKQNNYRLFTTEYIREILTIYALKFAVSSNSQIYSVDKVKDELKNFDYSDKDRIIAIANEIKQHLDKLNKLQIKGIAALYHLCVQVESGGFDKQI